MAVILRREQLDDLLFGLPSNPTRQWLMQHRPLVYQAYNALDCCTPREVWDVLFPRLDAQTRVIYGFEHRCQMPAIAMALRGVRIDHTRRAEAIHAYEEEEEAAGREAAELAASVWDARETRTGPCNAPDGQHKLHNWPRGVDPAEAVCKRCGLSRLRPAPINCGSPQQVAKLLYDLLDIRPRRDRITGGRTTNEEALESIKREAAEKEEDRKSEKLKAHWALVWKICDAVLRAKKARKQIGYARSKTGPDGRMRSGFNVGAAETGRWSASSAPDWTGWNLQQISDRLRHMIIADPGLEIWQADLKAAESHIVAYDAQDEAYIQAHAGSDVHTAVAALTWPELPWLHSWTEVTEADKKLAETPTHFDPHHTYRDYAKRIQHGGNMGRTAAGVARQIHIPVAEAQEIYNRMYGGGEHAGAFPRIKQRHAEVFAELQRTGVTISCLGRKRQFLGRVWDHDTLREALGQLEQSPVADVLNLALLRIWHEMDGRLNVFDAPHPDQPNRVWLLAQVHDAIWGLRRKGDDDALRRVVELMTVPILINGRLCVIPVDVGVGPAANKKSLVGWKP